MTVQAVLLLYLACTPGDAVVVHVVDEIGDAVPGAVIAANGLEATTDDHGDASVRLDRSYGGVVRADGFLPEPFVLGRAEPTVEIKLWAAEGRFAIHSAGDVMMGRRYGAPGTGDPLLPAGDEQAPRDLVSDVAPQFGAADYAMINLETVVSTLPIEAAYPAKRFLLETPPEAMSALGALSVDSAILANNHQRDWLEPGITDTLRALDDGGFPHTGGGLDEDEAAIPVVSGRVGVLAYTTVDGTVVNDTYPQDDEPIPGEAYDTWKYESRLWGDERYGIPVTHRRIGSAWRLVKAKLGDLPDADRAILWTSAARIYPELQDWVARRGHGGGHLWTASDGARDIAALRPEVDVLVVQLHMGYQFAAAPAQNVREAARAAVDDGADLVVCHHPHVLQGFEYYHGKLIAYSMGNFVFDQDFLSTFRTSWLRTVWEGSTLLDARMLPVFLDAYRPVPAADELAVGIARRLWEASNAAGTSERGADLAVRTVTAFQDRAPLRVAWEGGSAAILPEEPVSEVRTVTLDETGIGEVPDDVLTFAPSTGEVGRLLSGLGDFEDHDGDTQTGDTLAWTWTSDDVRITDRSPLAGRQSLEMYRDSANTEAVLARMTARIPLPDHRLWGDADGALPLDGDARYTVELRAERTGAATTAEIRLVLYHFDDLDPTEDPTSTVLGESVATFEVPADATRLRFDLPTEDFAIRDGLTVNAALLSVVLLPPASGSVRARFDDVDVIEWRLADLEPRAPAAIDRLRVDGFGSLDVTVLPLR